MANKTFPTAAACFADLRDLGVLKDGMTVMVGGFGLCGIPEQLIIALRDSGVKSITCISNNAGVDDWGLGLLLQTRQIRKMISSYVGENATFEKQFLGKELEVEFNPQGTLAERIRAGGAGIPAFFTATGAGTIVADGKETRRFFRPAEGVCGATIPGRGYAGVENNGTPAQNGSPREYVLETGLFADLALVKANKADSFGNLVYNKTARNFNPMMACAAAFTIAEVDETVPLGTFEPDQVHTPGSYIKRIVKTVSQKRIEQRTVRAAQRTAPHMDQTFLITGVSRGIGLEFARQLSSRSSTVIGTVRDPLAASEAAKVTAQLIKLDVSDPASLDGLAEQLGNTPIDVLINNAGVSSEAKTLDECTSAELQRVFMINGAAPVMVAKAAAANLRAGKRKTIVNITSQLGSIVNNTGGSSYAYRASKAALNMLTRSMAAELGPLGFVCVCLHPGWVRTDMGGQGAPLPPSKAVATMVRLIDRFDASDNGRFLNLDGGTLPW